MIIYTHTLNCKLLIMMIKTVPVLTEHSPGCQCMCRSWVPRRALPPGCVRQACHCWRHWCFRLHPRPSPSLSASLPGPLHYTQLLWLCECSKSKGTHLYIQMVIVPYWWVEHPFCHSTRSERNRAKENESAGEGKRGGERKGMKGGNRERERGGKGVREKARVCARMRTFACI